MDEGKPVQQRLEAHDRYQLEFKYNYALAVDKETKYRIATYIFVPHSLDITKETYSRDAFYGDLKNYVRLKTPEFTLRDILEEPQSPFSVIDAILAQDNWPQIPHVSRRLINSFKFLRAILKTSLRDHLDEARQALKKGRHNEAVRIVEMMVHCTETITKRYRDYAPELQRPGVRQRVQVSYRLTDESISLLVEERMLRAYLFATAQLDKPEDSPLCRCLEQRIAAEVSYRGAQGYSSIVKPGDNEEYTFRTSVLKKFTSSVLFLSTSVKREGTTVEQLLYAVAAGLSMIFATVVAFWVQARYGMFSMPLFVALVVAYMFKDRIKELSRILFARFLRNRIYDRRTVIRTLDGEHQLGYLREKMVYLRDEEVPKSVLAARNRQLLTELDNDGQGEQIILYLKQVVLHKGALQKLYPDAPEVRAIHDIMRLDMRPFLRKMDDPYQRRIYLDSGRLHTARLHKVYPINFILVYESSEKDGATISLRRRAILDRSGIVRVEKIN